MPLEFVQGSTPCHLYEIVHNPHTPTHNPLQSFHTLSITSCRLSVSSWATLGQVISLLSESMVLEMVPSGWMTSSVLGMRVLWHCVLLVDGQIMTAHMCRMQGLYVQVGDLHDWFDHLHICFGYVLVMSIFVLVVSTCTTCVTCTVPQRIT